MTHNPEVDKKRSLRLEWISFVYLLIFVLAVMAPSLVKKGYFGLRQEAIEELLIFCFGLVGLGTFIGYNRLMEVRLQERNTAIIDADRAKKELIDSYRYIGQVNRQIEMLKTLSNQTTMTLLEADAYRKDLLQSILSNAAAVLGTRFALLRFTDLVRLRTESETHFTTNADQPLRISNKELRALHDSEDPYVSIVTDAGQKLLIVSSDRRVSPVRAFLVFHMEEGRSFESEVSLLKVFANQAELVFDTLQRRREFGLTSPMQLIDAVTGAKKGEVS